jgi:hypothetical protein
VTPAHRHQIADLILEGYVRVDEDDPSRDEWWGHVYAALSKRGRKRVETTPAVDVTTPIVIQEKNVWVDPEPIWADSDLEAQILDVRRAVELAGRIRQVLGSPARTAPEPEPEIERASVWDRLSEEVVQP